ncbi:GntR family transcriptional regulator [Ramlibacter sp. G-1-2-2]|uniref:GntR family transcriptional regulator n=1 Tax=Ramlibacter agri TaxID=2728837 RepID=A0A848HD92_9BURK|nr:GntR family transcriptional regulator [Ramlibacter agri]
MPLSKYHQIYLVLLEQLQEGKFADGLPGELELARHFGVARITVRRALEQLANEKLIVREVGRGTRPAPRLEQANRGRKAASKGSAPQLKGLMENIVSLSRKTIVKVIEWRTIPANHELADALQLAEGDKVRKAVRRRSTSAGPMSHITTWVPEQLVHDVERSDLTNKPILELMQESGVELGRAIQTVSARQADAKVASELQVPVGSALLWVRRLVYDINDRPVQLLHGLYRPDRYEYRMELSQVGGVEARIVAKEILS